MTFKRTHWYQIAQYSNYPIKWNLEVNIFLRKILCGNLNEAISLTETNVTFKVKFSMQFEWWKTCKKVAQSLRWEYEQNIHQTVI